MVIVLKRFVRIEKWKLLKIRYVPRITGRDVFFSLRIQMTFNRLIVTL
ncbi:hypothetical protein SAMN06265367_1136 [Algoriphagus winogradskyi]|uniref:Uncharacterized protein n=1 Tax=Algoriphagus winogradskyi TaxID=237017 RepID=A0ABY1PKK4_9BACT|nr:hypothetical protein SAMN06265367_1136 [Algoriphagus winogradskyi]